MIDESKKGELGYTEDGIKIKHNNKGGQYIDADDVLKTEETHELLDDLKEQRKESNQKDN